VGDYREQGIPAEGLLNYLARFGWSYGDEEVFSMSDLIKKFSWDRCSTSDGRFDPAKLSAIAFEHLKTPALITDERYAAETEPYLRAQYGAFDAALTLRALPLVRPRARSYAEAAAAVDFLLLDEPVMEEKAQNKFLLSDRAVHLPDLRALLAAHPDFAAGAIETAVKAWAERDAIKLGAIAQPARVALTGRTVSPGLFDVMELLGKERTLARIDAAIAMRGPA
jgi:glutamyl-tRNA synthetase